MGIAENTQFTTIKKIPTYMIDLDINNLSKQLNSYDTEIPLSIDKFNQWFNIIKNIFLYSENDIKEKIVLNGINNSLDKLTLNIIINNSIINAMQSYDGICYINDANKRFIYRFNNKTQQSNILLVDMLQSGLNEQFMNIECPVCHKKLNKHIRNFGYKINGNKLIITHLECALQLPDLNIAKDNFSNFSFIIFNLLKLDKLNNNLNKKYNEQEIESNFHKWFTINRFEFNLIHNLQILELSKNSEYEDTDLYDEINKVLNKIQQKNNYNDVNDNINNIIIEYKEKILNIENSNNKNDFIDNLYKYKQFLNSKLSYNKILLDQCYLNNK